MELTTDNRDKDEMLHYLEARCEALEREIKRLGELVEELERRENRRQAYEDIYS